jgi:hypothetical protein
MGKLLAVIGATACGLVTAACIGLVAGQAPVFHWELAGLVVAVVSAASGAIAGGAGAASGKVAVGVVTGVLLGGAGFFLVSIGQQHPPALTFWGSVAVAAAAGIAGAVGGLIGRRTPEASHSS